MVAVKSHEADAFLRTLSPKINALLFYGIDEGLILERAQAAAGRERTGRRSQRTGVVV